jgi:D-alanine-D-alanine ligase
VSHRKISVLILFNSPQCSSHGHAFAECEAGVLAEVQAVGQALDKLRIPHRAVGVRWFQELPAVLAAADEPVVFNLVEGFWADEGQANLVPTVIRSFGKACTGNDTQGLLLSLDKWQSKTLLRAAGLPTPQGLMVRPGQPIPARDLFDGPYIVKPVQADGSEGIDKNNIVRGCGKALREIVRQIHDQQGQPALIEQYIDGRELNISVIYRDGGLQGLPLTEIDFSAFETERPRIVGYEAKWLAESFEYRHTPHLVPAPLSKRRAQRIRDLAIAACRTLACFEYSRVDFRLDQANRPYVLEVNANPDISLDAGFAAALRAAGVSYESFVKLAIDNAMARVRDSLKSQVPSLKSSHLTVQTSDSHLPIEIRRCRPEDRQTVLSFLAETGFFRPDEIEVARELLDAALADGPEGHYQSFVACADRSQLSDDDRQPATASEPAGWICFGPTPCTLGTYDIYWIGVAPAWQGRGIGRALTAFAERAISERGGRLLVVETSSRETYRRTRQFYEALGYSEAAHIADFYGPGDHRVILVKAANGWTDGNDRSDLPDNRTR